MHRDEVVTDAAGSGVGQQSLDDHLQLIVRALPEVTVSHTSFRVYKVERRPILVLESTPYDVVIVECDRIFDPHLFYGGANVIYVLFESELGRMHANHH